MTQSPFHAYRLRPAGASEWGQMRLSCRPWSLQGERVFLWRLLRRTRQSEGADRAAGPAPQQVQIQALMQAAGARGPLAGHVTR